MAAVYLLRSIQTRRGGGVAAAAGTTDPGSGAGADHKAEGRYEEEIESRVLVSTQTYLL